MRAGSWPAGARSPFEARSSPYAGEGRDGARPSSRRRIDETSPDSDPPQVPGSGTAVTAIPSLASLEWRLGVVESRQLELLTFRAEVTTELKRNNPEVMLLTEQGAETRRQLEDLRSKLTYLCDRDTEIRRQDFQGQIDGLKTQLTALDFQGQLNGVKSHLSALHISLDRGLPELTATVQTHVQDLAVMKTTATTIIQDGQAFSGRAPAYEGRPPAHACPGYFRRGIGYPVAAAGAFVGGLCSGCGGYRCSRTQRP